MSDLHYVLDETSLQDEAEFYMALYEAEQEQNALDEMACICATAFMVGILVWWWFC